LVLPLSLKRKFFLSAKERLGKETLLKKGLFKLFRLTVSQAILFTLAARAARFFKKSG